MVGVDPEIGSSALRFWLAAGSAALLVAASVLLLAQRQVRALGSIAGLGVVVLGAISASSMTWAFLEHSRGRDHDADRRALEMRAEELTGLALAPGSPLACLDAVAGEGVESACEKSLFATPASVAAGISYVAARLTLLSDVIAYEKSGGADIDRLLLQLRRSLEADRFGFLAHALAVRDGCTSKECKALTYLNDPSHLRANLSGETFDRYLEHYQTVWAQQPDSPVADAAHADPAATAQLTAPDQRKVLVNIDFPTAASIPPVSIMNPEPAARGAAGANATAPAMAASGPRRSRKQAATAPGPPAVQSVPASPAAAQAQSDPVWTPAPSTPTPQASATAATPAANFASGAGGPVQLNPFSSTQ